MSVLFRGLLRLAGLTSNPSSPDAGDLWWRSDLSQMHGSDGSSVPLIMGPSGNVPVVRSGGWHSLPAGGAAGSITPALNRAYALPLWPGRSSSLTSVAVEITLLGLGDIRSGLYEDSGSGVPDSLVADFGTVTSGLAGVRTWSPTPLSLAPVLHWLVIVQQGIINVGLRARNTWEPIISETSATLSGLRTAYYADGVTGVLPASFGTIDGAAQGPSALVLLS